MTQRRLINLTRSWPTRQLVAHNTRPRLILLLEKRRRHLLRPFTTVSTVLEAAYVRTIKASSLIHVRTNALARTAVSERWKLRNIASCHILRRSRYSAKQIARIRGHLSSRFPTGEDGFQKCFRRVGARVRVRLQNRRREQSARSPRPECSRRGSSREVVSRSREKTTPSARIVVRDQLGEETLTMTLETVRGVVRDQ